MTDALLFFVADLSHGRPWLNSPSEHYLFLPPALILLNKIMENKPLFLHFLSWYKDFDAITTNRYDHRTVPN